MWELLRQTGHRLDHRPDHSVSLRRFGPAAANITATTLVTGAVTAAGGAGGPDGKCRGDAAQDEAAEQARQLIVDLAAEVVSGGLQPIIDAMPDWQRELYDRGVQFDIPQLKNWTLGHAVHEVDEDSSPGSPGRTGGHQPGTPKAIRHNRQQAKERPQPVEPLAHPARRANWKRTTPDGPRRPTLRRRRP